MKFTRQSVAAALLVTTFAAGFATPAAVAAPSGASAAEAADAPPGGPGGPDGRGPEDRDGRDGRGPGGPGPDGGGFDDFGGPGPGAPGPGMPFGPLRGLKLSEAQQDKLFAIMHAQAPQRREQDKAMRKAEQGLRELARAERFDDARAVALTRELGQAVAAQELLRVRADAQVLAVLTPEQRAQLRQRHERKGDRERSPQDRPEAPQGQQAPQGVPGRP
jgi:periplasmic protein CpxP/Spy